MDSRKVEQALREIFDRYGAEIVHGHDRRFEAAVSDLLDERKYPEERVVLRRASESTALWTLLNTKSITEEGAESAVICLEKESRMTREDAVFVVQCVVSARGGDPGIVNIKKDGNPESVGMEIATGSTNDVKYSIDGQRIENQNTLTAPKTQNTSVCLLEAPCNMGSNKKTKRRKNFKGKVNLYSDRLEFIPDKRGEKEQLDYQDITKIGSIRKEDCMAMIIFSVIMGLIIGISEASLGILIVGMSLVILMFSLPKSLTLYSNKENELGYKIYYVIIFAGVHKKRAVDIIRREMRGML